MKIYVGLLARGEAADRTTIELDSLPGEGELVVFEGKRWWVLSCAQVIDGKRPVDAFMDIVDIPPEVWMDGELVRNPERDEWSDYERGGNKYAWWMDSWTILRAEDEET